MAINNQDIEFCTAANGDTTAKIQREDGRELYLHSSFNPVEEADFLIEKMPIQENTLYVVIGFGLGYHVQALLKRIPVSSRIVVVESSNWRLAIAAHGMKRRHGNKWMNDSRLVIKDFKKPETVCFTLADIFVKNKLHSLEMVTHIPSVATDEKFYREVIETIPREFAMRISAQIHTIDTTLEYNLTNYIANLPVTWHSPSIDRLRNKWAGQPVIIVSAGPSLTEQLDVLKSAQGKAIIVCVGTAVKALIKHGIRPDFVIAIDPYYENMAHFEGWDTTQAALLYYHNVWRGIPANYKGAKFWFTLQDEMPIPLQSDCRDSIFIAGGTVAFSALQFARHVKASPVILVGQDMSFYQGRTHAEGVEYNLSFSEENLPEGFFQIPGTNGISVVTNQAYYSYLVLMQEYILRNQDVKYINTSLTGAKIEGTEVKPLHEVITEFCTRPAETDKVIREIDSHYQPVSKKDIIKLLNKWEAEIIRFREKSNAADKVDKLISHFKNLELYKVNHIYYSQFFYAAGLKEKWPDRSSKTALAERLRAHAEFALEVIRRNRDELQ